MLKVYIDPWNSKLQDKNFFNLGPIKENRKDSLLPWEYLYNYCLNYFRYSYPTRFTIRFIYLIIHI